MFFQFQATVASSLSRIHDTALRLFAERGVSDVNVSELAQMAGVARGTIYNHVQEPSQLFTQVVTDVSREMYARSVASMEDIDDPAARLATGLRLFMRRAHEEPHWGRFIVRFALNNALLQTMMGEAPSADIARGIEIGRYKVDASQLSAIVALVAGTGLSGMLLVLDGHMTWRDAGSQTSELVLRSLGISAREARALATGTLPALAEAPRGEAGVARAKQNKARGAK